jgi:PIN domain nuclease of toxin-antitoxin system
MIALDASALLAYLFRETGHERVASFLGDSCLSTVNLSEVIGRFVRDGHDAHLVLKQISATPIEIVPFSPEQAALAASLQPQALTLGLSLADRACLSLAMQRNIAAATADRVWQGVQTGIQVIVIR